MAATLWVVKAEGRTDGRAPDLDEVRRALEVLPDSAHGVQLHASLSRKHWECRTFRGDDLDAMLSWVSERPTALGVYYSLNPCPPHLDRQMTNGDATHRRWLLIDVDRHKEPGTLDLSATDQEHEAARAAALRVLDVLTALGWPPPILICSGNGFHLLYRLMAPNNEETRNLIRDFLKALTAICPTVGRECHDARRIAKLPGTWAQKGPDTPQRPHRMARLLRVPEVLEVVPESLIALTTPRLVELVGSSDQSPAIPCPDPSPSGPFTLHATSGEGGNARAWALKALEKECGKMALARPGEINPQLYRSAAALGNIVGAGLLSESEVHDALLAAARQAGADDPVKDEDCFRRALEKGKTTPRAPEPSANGHPEPSRKPGWERPETYTLTQLLALDIPEPRWAVPGLLSEGLSILAGKPKLGKSWMALNLALTIAAGGKALGTTQTVPGDVLYLSLEDRLRRVQDRARKVLAGIGCGVSDRLHVSVKWPRQDQGGLEEIEKWMRAVEHPTLIIIDVWAKFRPAGKSSSSAYEQDYNHASELKALADRYACSTLPLHHCKKAAADDVVDEISGTLGLAGAADGLLVLSRARGENEANLFITGRDIQDEDMALTFDPQRFTWTCEGPAGVRTESKLKAALVAYFKANTGQSLGLTDLATATNTPKEKHGYLRCVLSRMATDGLVDRTGNGRYRWPIASPDEEGF